MKEKRQNTNRSSIDCLYSLFKKKIENKSRIWAGVEDSKCVF